MDPDGDGCRRWLVGRLAAGREGLDDDHAAAAAWTGGRRPNISIGLRLWHGEQFARPRDVVGTGRLGEQAVVAAAVEALRQDVDEEAAAELTGCQGPDLVSRVAVVRIVVVLV